ncbi:MAG: helix-turn-helix domain-containing protein [Bacteroidetes bacterium]|nr:helix-turn-helix domain-containing protein [Bacteroidota bacterium]
MKTELKYKVIKTKISIMIIVPNFYFFLKAIKRCEDEIELLNVLIEAFDRKNNSFQELDPVQLLRSFMKERNMKAIDLAVSLELSRGNLSDILNYKKGISKESIRKLSSMFKVSQEAFNRPYQLVKALESKPVKKLKFTVGTGARK